MEQELAAVIRQQISDDVLSRNSRGFYRPPLVGFSAADDPLYRRIKSVVGPWHKYPQEVLPAAVTVVSFFIPYTKKVVDSNRRSWPQPGRYWVEAYHACNCLIDDISHRVAKLLRRQGFQAKPMASINDFDPVNIVASWSHRSAAYIAGLGSFGLNRMLITEKGCAGRFGSVLTSARIAPTPRSAPRYCPAVAGGACDFCIKNCPIQALSSDPTQDLQRRACYDQCLLPSPYRPEGASADCCGKCAVGPCAYFE